MKNIFDLSFALQYEGRFNFDTRTIKNGDVFIALNTKEQKIDGHNFIDDAINKGAAFCIASNNFINNNANINEKLVYCSADDVLESISLVVKQKIEYLKSKGAKIIAITGSVGKTTTKNLIKFICDELYGSDFCYATSANYNNFIGVPYTILQGGSKAKTLAIEIGMDKVGEIDHLSSIIKPDISVITQISGVHLANFESIHQIAIAKSECVKHSQILLTHKKINFASIFIGVCKMHNIKYLNPLWNVTKYKNQGFHTIFQFKNININKSKLSSQMSISKPLTKQYLQNITLALDAINLCGHDLTLKQVENIKFSDFYLSQALPGRGNWIQSTIGSHKFTIIDESYNASPVSVKNSLQNLALMSQKCCRFGIKKLTVNDIKKAIILGDMMELGVDEITIHKSLISHIIKAKPSIIIFVGSRMKSIFDELNKCKKSPFCLTKISKNCKIYHFNNHIDLINDIESVKSIILQESIDFLLVKSSHSIKLNAVVDKLSK